MVIALALVAAMPGVAAASAPTIDVRASRGAGADRRAAQRPRRSLRCRGGRRQRRRPRRSAGGRAARRPAGAAPTPARRTSSSAVTSRPRAPRRAGVARLPHRRCGPASAHVPSRREPVVERRRQRGRRRGRRQRRRPRRARLQGRTADNALLPSAVFVVFGKRDAAAVDLASLGTGGFAIRGDGSAVVGRRGPGGGRRQRRRPRRCRGLAAGVDGDEDAGTVAIVFGKADSATVDISAGQFDPPAWGIRAVGGTSGMLLGSTDGSGAAVAAAGDVNGDGLGDVLLGAAGASSRERQGLRHRHGLRAPSGTRTPRQVTLRPGQRFGGFAVPCAARVLGASAPRSPGSAGNCRRRPGQPANGVAAQPGSCAAATLHPPASSGPRDAADPRVQGRRARQRPRATAARTSSPSGTRPPRSAVRALLFSSSGRRLATYRGLRNSREARSAAAGAGDVGGSRRPDLIFGSPGTSTAYVLVRARRGKETP